MSLAVDDVYDRLTVRVQRLNKLVTLKAPMGVIFGAIKTLHKSMPEFEEAYTKWATAQIKEDISRCRNNYGMCAECPEKIQGDEPLGLCPNCAKPYAELNFDSEM